jgi:hypothetical protein
MAQRLADSATDNCDSSRMDTPVFSTISLPRMGTRRSPRPIKAQALYIRQLHRAEFGSQKSRNHKPTLRVEHPTPDLAFGPSGGHHCLVESQRPPESVRFISRSLQPQTWWDRVSAWGGRPSRSGPRDRSSRCQSKRRDESSDRAKLYARHKSSSRPRLG